MEPESEFLQAKDLQLLITNIILKRADISRGPGGMPQMA